MNDSCAEHRPYIGALADHETALAPASSVEHILDCPACSAELIAHRSINRKLAAGIVAEAPATVRPKRRGTRTRLLRLAVAAALVASLAGAGLGWHASHGPDVIATAASMAREGPTLHTTNVQEIATWCATQSSRRAPVIAVPPLTPWGARMDGRDGASVVTVFYSVGSGRHVSVGWLDENYSGPAGTRAEARLVDGRIVVVARAPTGMAVITGDAPLPVLWNVVGTLEGSSG